MEASIVAIACVSLVTIWCRIPRAKNPHHLVGAHGLVWCSKCHTDEGLLGECPIHPGISK